MTLTKSDFIDSIYNQCGFSRSKSTQLVEAMLEIIKPSDRERHDFRSAAGGNLQMLRGAERSVEREGVALAMKMVMKT
jgi:nucleoid DNA-binding protein